MLGVKKGDRVAIYMPMVIELTVAMLACARIGAVHSIIVSIKRRGIHSSNYDAHINEFFLWMIPAIRDDIHV